ncbi:MAG: hypothetical protein IPK22_28865 [Verrucomicrobiaceae bacterium]|nr:hypothetical protein [Verrucomicrobiaceae bacterium]
MSAKPEKRRSAIDTLVVRDHTAAFWFLVACFVGAGCGTYLMMLSAVVKKLPTFVVMDTAGAFYVPSGLVFNHEQNNGMHVQMGDLLAETLLTRTAEGLVYADRLPKLYWENEKRDKPAEQQIETELEKEQNYFRSQQVKQTVTIEKTTIIGTRSTRVGTSTTGIVRRDSIFQGKEKVEFYRFELKVKWHQNLLIISNRGFPSQVEELASLTLEPVTEP